MKNRIIVAAGLALLLALTGCSVPKVEVTNAKPQAQEEKPAEEKITPPPATGPEEGSREAPLPYGQEVTVYDIATNDPLWKITVAGTSDATEAIAQANQFNEPPAAGNIYLAIPVHIVWQGAEPVQPWADFQNGIDVNYVDASGVTHEEEFVVQPWPSLMDIADLYQGGAADFTTVVQVPAGTTGLVRISASNLDFFVGDRG